MIKLYKDQFCILFMVLNNIICVYIYIYILHGTIYMHTIIQYAIYKLYRYTIDILAIIIHIYIYMILILIYIYYRDIIFIYFVYRYIDILIDQQPGGNPALDGTRDVDQLDLWWEGGARRGLRRSVVKTKRLNWDSYRNINEYNL